MGALVDATCPKCRKRFGWAGEMIDRPPCPRCGHQLPLEELKAADEEMEVFRQQLLSRKENRDRGTDRKNQGSEYGLPPELPDST